MLRSNCRWPKETTSRQDKKFVAGPLKDNSMCIETNPRFHKVQTRQYFWVFLFVCFVGRQEIKLLHRKKPIKCTLDWCQYWYWIFLWYCALNACMAQYSLNAFKWRKSNLKNFIRSISSYYLFYLHFTWLCVSWYHQRILKK